MVRTTIKTVIFKHPFLLDCVEGILPAGRYYVETDEEVISGLSFLAYRRLCTTMTVPVSGSPAASWQAVTIDAEDLESALVRDAQYCE